MNYLNAMQKMGFAAPALNAFFFASAAHAAVGQVRKYTGEPYIAHPVGVLKLLAQHLKDENLTMLVAQAALLHDVVEDTSVTLEQVREHFGATVAEYVGWLTKATTPSFGNRAARHAFEVDRLSRAPLAARIIKVADLIDNTRSIVERDPVFARTYLPEKRDLLLAIAPDVPGVLMREAWSQLNAGATVIAIDDLKESA